MLALVGGTLLWASIGRLDIVAVAEGKLVPATYLKIVQPAEQGDGEGDPGARRARRCSEGQVLMRMDAGAIRRGRRGRSRPSSRTSASRLRRIDAQLARPALAQRRRTIRPSCSRQVEAQYAANVRAYENALAQERALLDKARQDLAAAQAR